MKLIRDRLSGWVPWWMSDRVALNAGFRFLWVQVAMLDAYVDWLVQGLQAPWPGQGTPTALPLIGRSRGIVRGEADTDATYAAKLRAWLDTWRNAGDAKELARQIRGYLASAPRVRIYNRAGLCITVDGAGVSIVQSTWDWDSISNPERAGYWSDLFVVVYTSAFPAAGTLGDGTKIGDRVGLGIGHGVNRQQYDAVRGLIADWKAAHSRVRAVIWTTDATLFNPASPSTRPNGKWGQWGITVGGVRVPSDRNTTSCRYWEL